MTTVDPDFIHYGPALWGAVRSIQIRHRLKLHRSLVSLLSIPFISILLGKMTSFSTTPFADPLWLNRGFSPYYTDSHRRLQKEVREYVDTYIAPFCEEWEKTGVVPQEVRL
jgi:hypothetical protein